MIAVAPLALASIFQTAQQTREPPLPGSPTQPVPVVPAPVQPMPVLPMQPAPPMSPFGPAAPVLDICPPIDPPVPVVKLKVRVAACAVAGQEIDYRILVENCSCAPAHHVLVRNPLPANARFVRATPSPAPPGDDSDLVWVFGTLPPGACREICLVLAPTNACDVKNCARVQFEHGQCVVTRIANAPPIIGEPPVPAEPKVVPKAVEPKEPPKVSAGPTNLSVKITGPNRQYANLPAKYQITVTNTSDKVADNVVVSALLPEKSVMLELGDKGHMHFGVAAWLVGNLPPGESKTVQLTYKVSQAGEFCLKATAKSETGVSSETQLCTTFEGVSALYLETRDITDPIDVGGQTSYRVTLTNQGTAPLTNVRLEARVPLEMSTYRTAGPTSAPEKLPPADADGQLVTFAPLKELKPGEKLTYEVFVKAVKAGDARLKVTLTADELKAGGPVIEEESTQVFRDDDPFKPMKRVRVGAIRGQGSFVRSTLRAVPANEPCPLIAPTLSPRSGV
jgi:uncharacterized repeat protein (TIGR01451 family)